MSTVIECLSHFLAATIQSEWRGRQERYRRRRIRGWRRKAYGGGGRKNENQRKGKEIGASEEDKTPREGNKEGE